jgi:predicted CoA-substrate-specific enzyme activase
MDAEKHLLGYAIKKSGTDFTATAQECLAGALKMADAEPADIKNAVSTGYGRKNVTYASGAKTEIGCHGSGCFLYFPKPITIIDIGGQDNKVIKLDEKGRRINFKMNRKCAAGTGAFLEEMSARLDIPLEEMDELASHSKDMVKLGSFCTVFSATEVLENIRHGKKIEDIVKGVFFSVIRRVLEMDSMTENVVMTGGVVAHNRYLVKMAEEMIERPVLVPEHPQLTGAIGAALYAMNRE